MTSVFLSKNVTERFLSVYSEYREKIVGYGIDFIIANLAEDEKTYILDFCEVRNLFPQERIGGSSEIDKLQSREDRAAAWFSIQKKFKINKPKHIRCEGKLIIPN